MLQSNHGGLDPSTARFTTQYNTGQTGATGSGFPLSGNVPGLQNFQGNYGMQNSLPGARPNMGNMGPLPSGAGQNTGLQGRFGGGNPILQQLGPYGQGPARGVPGHPMLNGITAPAGARGVGGVTGLPGGVRPGGNPPAGVAGLAGLGANTTASNLAALQRGGGGGVNMGGVVSNARLGVGLGNIGGGGNQNPEFSIQTEDFPPIGAATRQDQQGQGQAGQLPPRMPQGQQLRGQQQAAPGQMPQGFPALSRQQLQGAPPTNAGGGLGDVHPGMAAELSRGQSPYSDLGSDFGGLQQPGGGASMQQNYEQMLRYQQQLRAQVPLKQQQAAAQAGVGGGAAPAGGKLGALPPDRFGLLGLLSVIRMTDQDLTTLALGTDLTTLGLNLNSPENLYKTFASPWADGPQKPEPEFKVPACYLHNPPRLQPGYFSKFQQDTLFYIFYSMPGDEAQLFAADELCFRGWWYHKEFKLWLTRLPVGEPSREPVKTDRFERGSYMLFNTNTWEVERKDNFTVVYEQLERAPNLPRPGQQAAQQPGPPPGSVPPPQQK